jgi:hypothetical protein
MRNTLLFVVALLAIAAFFASCDSLTGGGKKIIINEGVCDSVGFLRMKVGEETEIVLDNTSHSENQKEITLILTEFPILITGDLPPDTQVGPTFTTTRLRAPAGEKTSVKVEPTFAGQFRARCNLSISQAGGARSVQLTLTFQIVD